VKDHCGGRPQILKVRQIRRINGHPVESDEDSAPDAISDTVDRLNWNGDLDNPNDREDDCRPDIESDVEQPNRIEDPDCPEQRDVSATPHVPGLIQPTRKPKRPAEKRLMTVNAIEMRRSKGVNNQLHRLGQYFTSVFLYLELEF